jgi:hypothetical protein
MGRYGYVYSDVSWVLTLGWSTMILGVVTVVDKRFVKKNEWQRFGIYIALLTILGYLAEAVVVNIGIREYSPEVLKLISGIYFLGIPIEAAYYIPVFMALVIGFYKYWSLTIDKIAVVPVKKTRWLRNLFFSLIAVFMFEVVIDPMVVNANLPSWSYFYHDVSFLMTGLWIVVIWSTISVVENLFIHLDLTKRFLLYLFFTTFNMGQVQWQIFLGFDLLYLMFL